MKTLVLTHANNNQPLYVATSQLFYYYFSDAHKSVIIVSSGGAYVPVKETADEITRLRESNTKEVPNGN